MTHAKRSSAPILIIDDDEGSRRALADVLIDEGYDVVTASGGADGLSYLQHGRLPRVILLDLMMPGTDGWDFRAVQKHDPRLAAIPVVAISAAGKLVDADHSFRKPINLDALLKLLQDLAPV
jgi:CheY-like chemotaxis protein